MHSSKQQLVKISITGEFYHLVHYNCATLVSRRRAGMLRVSHREVKDESVKVACPLRLNNYLL